jgi:hypothetical protein
MSEKIRFFPIPRTTRNFAFVSTDLRQKDWERLFRLKLPKAVRFAFEDLQRNGNQPTPERNFSPTFNPERVAVILSKNQIQDIRLVISGIGERYEQFYQLARVECKMVKK